MLDAFQLVRPACDFAGVLPEDAAVTVAGGWMFAKNAQLSVCQPVSRDVPNFAVAASDIDLILRHVGECTVVVKDSKVVVKSKGERQTSVKLVQPQTIPTKPDVPTQEVGDIDDFLAALSDVFPFTVGDPSKPWSKGARFEKDCVVATNALMLCRAELVSAWGLEGQTVSRGALAYIRMRGKALKRLGVKNGTILMEFDDGGWARAACINPGMPDAALTLIEKSVDEDAWNHLQKVTDDYRDAFLAAFALTDDRLLVYPNRIFGARAGVEDNCPVKTTLAQGVESAIFKAQDLTAVITKASRIGFNHYPKPVPFVTERGSKGLIAGLK